MKINAERLRTSLLELGHIGYQDGIGTSRMAYSEAFCKGREYVERCMQQAGLETYVDPVGNLTGILPGSVSGARIISAGSHIDTVPGGGMYDGTLGVMAAIEAVQTMKECQYSNCHPIEVIAFNEEEGNVVGGTFGSKAFAGQPQEESALQKLAEHGMCEDDISRSKRNPDDYRCYLELHIEQGGILESKGLELGVVEGIVGITRFMVTVPGEANHAGSTPMNLRDDALVKACGMVERIVEISKVVDPAMTCTIGYMEIEPGAVNVVPGCVRFPIELRCLRMESIRTAIAQFEAEVKQSGTTVKNFLWQEPTIMDEKLRSTFDAVCQKNGSRYCHMPSGAGHDAINMALFTPTAMLFVPSVAGISHSPREFTKPEDLERGTQALLDTILMLDRE